MSTLRFVLVVFVVVFVVVFFGRGLVLDVVMFVFVLVVDLGLGLVATLRAAFTLSCRLTL